MHCGRGSDSPLRCPRRNPRLRTTHLAAARRCSAPLLSEQGRRCRSSAMSRTGHPAATAGTPRLPARCPTRTAGRPGMRAVSPAERPARRTARRRLRPSARTAQTRERSRSRSCPCSPRPPRASPRALHPACRTERGYLMRSRRRRSAGPPLSRPSPPRGGAL